MCKLSKHVNIGEALERQLEEVGIYDYNALCEAGSEAAWLKIQQIDASACYNRLCALEGAIRGVRWGQLDAETKATLKAFYQGHRK